MQVLIQIPIQTPHIVIGDLHVEPHRYLYEKKTKIYAIGRCQTILLIISLLCNFILLYWATEPYTRSTPINSKCKDISNDPNSPCNPDYLTQLIQSNPKLKNKLQQSGITVNSIEKHKNKNHPIWSKVKQKYYREQNSLLAYENNNIDNSLNEITDNNNINTGNKRLSKKDLQITTAKA
eukprot:795439_1